MTASVLAATPVATVSSSEQWLTEQELAACLSGSNTTKASHILMSGASCRDVVVICWSGVGLGRAWRSDYLIKQLPLAR